MRYSGKLGLVEQKEVRPGIWENTVTEVPVLGTVRQTTDMLAGAGDILPKHSTTTSVSVPARGVGLIDNSNIQYITFKGKRWQISTIVERPPRIEIYIGEVYNGPTPDRAPGDAQGS